jgi:hypothetical protein
MAKSRTPRTATRKAAGQRKPVKKTAKRRKAARTVARKAKKAAKRVVRKAAAGKAASRPTRTAARRKSVAKGRSKPRDKAKAAKVVRKAAKAPARVTSTTRPASAARTTAPVTKAARPSQSIRKPALDRERRRLPEASLPPSPPSSLGLDQRASAAKSGRREIQEHLSEHTETGPVITAGDVDADWESAYSTGDEAPGGDNPTPDQDVVDEIGRSLGLEYEDNEELKGADKVEARDKHRWELDPASSEDYKDRE